MTVTDADPTLDEINAVLRHRLSWEAMSAEQASRPLEITPEQVLQLVRRLGWHPTPTVDECVDESGKFYCPKCGHDRIEHVAEGPCDLRDVNGLTSQGLVEIVDTFKGCGSEGDWWLQCRHCVFEFNLRTDLEVEWR